MNNIPMPKDRTFVEMPLDPPLSLAWPTSRHDLFSAPDDYFAKTRANPFYGMPGWTRECGKRFHRGCDIAAHRPIPTGRSMTIMFTDCVTDTEYPSEEPTWLPDDDVFAVFTGIVVKCHIDDTVSDFGRHVILRHIWPTSQKPFFSLYAHLDSIDVQIGEQVESGRKLGRMGQTSKSQMGRDFMSIAPHLHLEFWDDQGKSYDPAEMLKRYISRDD